MYMYVCMYVCVCTLYMYVFTYNYASLYNYVCAHDVRHSFRPSWVGPLPPMNTLMMSSLLIFGARILFKRPSNMPRYAAAIEVSPMCLMSIIWNGYYLGMQQTIWS